MDATSLISSIYTIIDTLRTIAEEVECNKKLCHRLSERCDGLRAPLQTLEQDSLKAASARTVLSRLHILLDDIREFMLKFKDQSYFMKVWKHNSDQGCFTDLNSHLSQTIQDLELGIVIDIETRRKEDMEDVKIDHLEFLDILLQSMREQKSISNKIMDELLLSRKIQMKETIKLLQKVEHGHHTIIQKIESTMETSRQTDSHSDICITSQESIVPETNQDVHVESKDTPLQMETDVEICIPQMTEEQRKEQMLVDKECISLETRGWNIEPHHGGFWHRINHNGGRGHHAHLTGLRAFPNERPFYWVIHIICLRSNQAFGIVSNNQLGDSEIICRHATFYGWADGGPNNVHRALKGGEPTPINNGKSEWEDGDELILKYDPIERSLYMWNFRLNRLYGVYDLPNIVFYICVNMYHLDSEIQIRIAEEEEIQILNNTIQIYKRTRDEKLLQAETDAERRMEQIIFDKQCLFLQTKCWNIERHNGGFRHRTNYSGGEIAHMIGIRALPNERPFYWVIHIIRRISDMTFGVLSNRQLKSYENCCLDDTFYGWIDKDLFNLHRVSKAGKLTHIYYRKPEWEDGDEMIIKYDPIGHSLHLLNPRLDRLYGIYDLPNIVFYICVHMSQRYSEIKIRIAEEEEIQIVNNKIQ
jgi:hypothetical protein